MCFSRFSPFIDGAAMNILFLYILVNMCEHFVPGYEQKFQITGLIVYTSVQFYRIISICVSKWSYEFLLLPAPRDSIDLSTFGNVDTNFSQSNDFKYPALC